MRNVIAAIALLPASPAFAASGDYGTFSLRNTDFVVAIGFVVFIGVLIYFKVPGMLTRMLDDRSKGIQSDLDEARAIREEAQSLLADYERKTREAKDQADDIVAAARKDAEASAEQARRDLDVSVERRLAAADEQIKSAQNAAIRDVRDRAIAMATAAAADVLARQMTSDRASRMIDDSIETVRAKLH